MKRAFLVPCVAAVALLSMPRLARAQPPADVPPDLPPAPVSNRPEFTFAAGLRGTILPNAGLQPYASSNDVLAQSSILVGATLFRAGSVSLVASFEWNYGSLSDTARTQTASVAMHRFAGAIESRFQPAHRLYLFAKVAPGALAVLGSIQAPAPDGPLTSRSWTWGLDTTGGAGLLLGGSAVRFWLTGELGYAFAGSVTMNYAPTGDTGRVGTTMLPAFRPAGGVSRFALAMAF